MTTSARQDYIRMIWKLGGSNEFVKSKDLSDALGLAKSTVSERLRGLADENLVEFEKYGGVRLTNKGDSLAKSLTFKHRIIEVFLHDFLKVPKSDVHREANELEHAFSDDVILRLDKFMGNPKIDPHGKPIEKRVGRDVL